MSILSCLFWTCIWNIQWRWSSTYVYCVVCYRVIVAPYVTSVGNVFAYLSERPMDYETSLLPKVFPSHEYPILNPCWSMVSILCFSKWHSICLHIICSMTLQHIQVSDTGMEIHLELVVVYYTSDQGRQEFICRSLYPTSQIITIQIYSSQEQCKS